MTAIICTSQVVFIFHSLVCECSVHVYIDQPGLQMYMTCVSVHKHANVFIDYIMLLSIVFCYTVHTVHVYVHNTFMLTTSKCCVL